MSARKFYGTGDGVSMVGGEWRTDASLERALAAVAEARLPSVPAIPPIRLPARDAAWAYPQLDEVA